MDTLEQIFQRHATFGADVGHGDKGSTHSYIQVYEKLLAPFRECGSILEVGLACGWSLDMWAEYFGAKARIVGMDISVTFDTARFDSRVKVIEADATSRTAVTALAGEKFDVIIDDGSHMESDQSATFELLSPLVKPGGVYIIEDIISPESSISRLSGMRSGCEVHDLRGVKGRFDDVLLVFRF